MILLLLFLILPPSHRALLPPPAATERIIFVFPTNGTVLPFTLSEDGHLMELDVRLASSTKHTERELCTMLDDTERTTHCELLSVMGSAGIKLVGLLPGKHSVSVHLRLAGSTVAVEGSGERVEFVVADDRGRTDVDIHGMRTDGSGAQDPASRKAAVDFVYRNAFWGSRGMTGGTPDWFVQQFPDAEESYQHAGYLSHTELMGHVRRHLRHVIDDYGITSLLDVPCGDFSWMRHADLRGVDYVGADLSTEGLKLARKNAEKAKSDEERYRSNAPRSLSFVELDMVSDLHPWPKPPAGSSSGFDLIFTRLVLAQLTPSDALEALRRIQASGARWLLAETFPFVHKTDAASSWGTTWSLIQFGDERKINLQLPPYCLKPPELMIKDTDPGRYIALFDAQTMFDPAPDELTDECKRMKDK